MRMRMSLYLLLLLAGLPLLAADFTLKLEGVEDEVLVSLPSNHDPAKSYPAIFYYHGTNGRPSTELLRGHTGGEDWIVVGMAYAQRGTFRLTPAGMDAEVAVFRKVKSELQTRAGLAPERVYVSGFSKGGWVSGLLLQKERSIAGAAILGAGHMHQLEAVPKPLREGTPVFVGVGRHDRNYPFGLKAVLFYRSLGADIQMEAWRGLEHQFPDYGSTGLKEWLALQNGQVPDEGALETELAAIQQLKGFEKWWGLVEFAERPYVKAVSGLPEKVAQARALAEEEESLAREARILSTSRRLLGREIGKKSLKDLEEIVAGYAQIAESAGDSPQGPVAAKDYERVAEILDLAYQQQPQEPTPIAPAGKEPTGNERERIPMNPLVR